MKILVTGAKGFIGKNLCLSLQNVGHEVFAYDLGSSDDELKTFISHADWIFHLAGVNKPLKPEEFIDGNVNLTKKLIDYLTATGSHAPIVYSSSTQAALDNPYGQSKKMAEDELFAFQEKNNHPVYVFRLYNAFGKWCRPNYNSVVATFCYNVAHNLPLQINETAPAIDFVYIDDIVASFINLLSSDGRGSTHILYPEPHYSEKLDDIAKALYQFKASRNDFMVPNIEDPFFKKLYSTYLSYLEEDDFSYALAPHIDQRGSFTEVLKTQHLGQVSVNVSKPGITKGNHYHMSKNEKYLVVEGTCEIKFRKVGTDKVIIYKCSGSDMKVVDIPPGYTHCITNVGKTDSVTLMWANELFDPNHPDTVFMPVEEDKK
jgi:UDP-2-acetamido-2,6-beta-L-arabino-hexul-4-ose reductase